MRLKSLLCATSLAVASATHATSTEPSGPAPAIAAATPPAQADPAAAQEGADASGKLKQAAALDTERRAMLADIAQLEQRYNGLQNQADGSADAELQRLQKVLQTKRQEADELEARIHQTAPTFAVEDPDPSNRPTDEADLKAEAFGAAQSSLAIGAGDALTKVAVAMANGTSQVAVLERDRERAAELLAADEKRLNGVLGDPSKDSERKRLETEMAKQRSLIAANEAEIKKLDPSYFDLTRPRALALSDVQALLNPDEALLFLLESEDATYTFAVTRDRIDWARAPDLDQAHLSPAVATLRKGLQVDAKTRGTSGGFNRGAAQPSFDARLAFQLYAQLVKPVEATLAGKTAVMTVATGSLSSLPLQVLVTSDPGSGPTQAPQYLADRYATLSLPSVDSLRSLRCLLVAPSQRHPGCGAVQGRGEQTAAAGGPVVAGFGAPVLSGKGQSRGLPPTGFGEVFKSQLADTNWLRQNLSDLPGAQAELEAIKKTYGARAEVHLGAEATEAAVKASANGGDLSKARYVIFSTHGLLAGQAGVEGEPGLVFTPPAEDKKSQTDDGFLTASEAASLHLSAELLVLSACNTGESGGKSGDEGLSGLARAFFYAGARSMLVSHWEVDDLATEALMKTTFTNLDARTGNRVQAWQAAMRAVRAQFPSPGKWGAFALVGVPDGGGAR